MIAILVPVLGREKQLAFVLESIAANTTVPHRVVLIFSPDDTETIKFASGAENTDILITNWFAGRSDYAKKLAFGFEHTQQPWFFQGATDLDFYPNWDTEALKAAERVGAGVVGTNDLGNPLVKRGRHSTHSLISRNYIETWGGTVDGSGLIFSEAYDHQWTDNEFIETAIQRRQFVFAKNSIVEHLHPHWAKNEMDSTYEKATRETFEDQTLFLKRRSLIVQGVARQRRRA